MFNPARPTHATTINPADLPAIVAGQRTALVFLSTAGPHAAASAVEGDLVYVDAGQICAGARVARVDSFENLTAQDLRLLRESYGPRTVGDGSAWTGRLDSRFATVVWLCDVRPLQDRSGVPGALRAQSSADWRTATDGGVEHRNVAA